MNIRLNKDKSIGKVLYIVEGGKTEPYILYRIFCTILDYQMETIIRDKGYHKFNSKDKPASQVFVINAEESNIKYIDKNNMFLDNLFKELIENYDFDVDNAAIFYLFDRDSKSNVDKEFIDKMLSVLTNSRENNGYDRQGMLLLSYPSIESFTLSNFVENCFDEKFATGHSLKYDLNKRKINQSNISEKTLVQAMRELIYALEKMGIKDIDIDDFEKSNKRVFEYEEDEHIQNELYRALSLICISLVDLGILEICEDSEDIYE